MNPYLIHAQDVLALQSEAGGDCPTFTATVQGQNKAWPILPGTAMTNRPLREGGFSQMYDLSFNAVVSQFGIDANSLKEQLLNQIIQYVGINFRIFSVHILAGATMIKVEANSANQNA